MTASGSSAVIIMAKKVKLSYRIPIEELFTAEVESNQFKDASVTLWQLNPDKPFAYLTVTEVNAQ